MKKVVNNLTSDIVPNKKIIKIYGITRQYDNNEKKNQRNLFWFQMKKQESF